MRRDHMYTHPQGVPLVNELAVIFMVVFLLINFVPGYMDHKLFGSWFLLFCVVRLMCGCFIVLPEKNQEEKSGRIVDSLKS